MKDETAVAKAAAELDHAASSFGFFYATGHGIDHRHFDELLAASERFFALPDAVKAEIGMDKGGRVWRGWFPIKGELTSYLPDIKEGLYLGEELDPGDPRVEAGLPLHGANLWPASIPELRTAVERYLGAATLAAESLMRGMALALGLAPGHFTSDLTRQPTLLFRIFHYPEPTVQDNDASLYGVGEHSDYGLLTLLGQDDKGGLSVRGPDGWIDVPPQGDDLVVNIGDMFERLTRGRYRSATHRVTNSSGQSRYSFPLFYDPGFAAAVEPLPIARADNTTRERWDGVDLHQPFENYGDYLLSKVGKVFPDLAKAQLD